MIQVDLPMPEACDVCPFNYDFCWCNAFGNNDEWEKYSDDWNDHVCDRETRPEYCPLKEQEAVEPTLIREGRNKYYNTYVCPRCDNDVVYEQNYCSECGVKFMWESR